MTIPCVVYINLPSKRDKTLKMISTNERIARSGRGEKTVHRSGNDEVVRRSDPAGSLNVSSDGTTGMDDVELGKMNKRDLVTECQERNKKMRKLEENLENQKNNVSRLLGELEDMRKNMKILQSKVDDSTRVSEVSAITTCSIATAGLVALAQDYTAGQKAYLGRVVRHDVFRKHKVMKKEALRVAIFRECATQGLGWDTCRMTLCWLIKKHS